MRILITEDDAALGEALRYSLTHSGYAVDWMQNGALADQALRSDVFDLLILDLGLPQLDGYDVLKRLRKHDGRIPVLILSGRESAGDKVHGLDLGADDYLVKPFAPDELLVRVRALLRRAVGDRPRTGRLTAREQQVLQLLADGLSQRDIADTLVISPRTAGKHIERILEKLEVRSRAQAVAVAYRTDLVATR